MLLNNNKTQFTLTLANIGVIKSGGILVEAFNAVFTVSAFGVVLAVVTDSSSPVSGCRKEAGVKVTFFSMVVTIAC